jgi:hypothetical protein
MGDGAKRFLAALKQVMHEEELQCGMTLLSVITD